MSKITRLGNELYTGRKSIDFVGRRWLWYTISGVIVLVAILALTLKGLNWGIEFTGGAEFRVTTPGQTVSQDEVDQVRQEVAATGIDAASAPVVSSSGTDTILVQTEPLSDAESATVTQVILDVTGGTESDFSQSEIGPSWGAEVAQRALLGLGVFLVLVTLFIWAYFREWKMSVAALVALAHDLIITTGVYALSGFEVSPATVTGLLTILGFSLYDTVVVFDKVRENTKDLRARRTTYAAAANLAVNQTLVRSINTSIVALIPVGCILYVGVVQLGSGAMKDLALALFVGMAAGVYSSIFIATPLVAHLKSNESEVQAAERRAKARERQQADRYATVPSFSEDMSITDEPGAGGELDAEGAPVSGATGSSGARPEASGRGRVAPASRGPVQQSSASGRQQPTRQPRSKRGKK